MIRIFKKVVQKIVSRKEFYGNKNSKYETGIDQYEC